MEAALGLSVKPPPIVENIVPVEEKTCDVLVIGSGAAAFSAALRASETMQVLMVEKDAKFGGATARSGGGTWIPNNHHAKEQGLEDSREQGDTYFRSEVGNRYDGRRVGAYLDYGPKVIQYIEQRTTLRFQASAMFPDCHWTAPGASQGGRSLFPEPWDAAELGDEIDRLRPVFKSATFMDMQVGVGDAPVFLMGGRKLKAAAYVGLVMAKRLRDQFRAGRTLRLTSGNALVGAMAAAAFRDGVELWTSAPARELLYEDGRVVGAIVDRPEGRVRVKAKRGVILATGGFAHDAERRSKAFPEADRMSEFWSLYPFANAGDGIRLGEAVGAKFDDDMKSNIGFTTATTVMHGEGQNEILPMFFNRAVPGSIHVTRRGKRFANEGYAPHEWAQSLIKATEGDGSPVAWIVCDHRALKRYGLGVVKPAPFSYAQQIKSGYLKTGRTLGELAENCGIDPSGLEQTVAEFNASAVNGVDPHFDRGKTMYEAINGDFEHKPNPCVRPIEHGPFFAIRVFASAICTFAGLKADENARVLNNDGEVIEGLYVAGNDMASISGGDYISAGITIGPALTFGHIAADHIASQTDQVARDATTPRSAGKTARLSSV